jgi:hypothetical protein
MKMKHLIAGAALAGAIALLLVPRPAPAQAQVRPELAILYTIDGFTDRAVGKVKMPNLEALMAQGVYYKQNWTIQTADPSNRFPPSAWAAAGYTSSVPNVVQMSGTVFIDPGKQKFLQDSFFPLKITAHVANEISYRSLDQSFHYTAQAGGTAMRGLFPVGNDKSLFWALEFLRNANPTFMWVHMQDTGIAAGEGRTAPPGAPWRNDILGEGSPYIKALQQEDVYLGQLVDALKKSGKWERTVMFITGDHGEQAAGGHPANEPTAWTMPLVMVGPGIKKGVSFDYTEVIDTVPTLTYLMGVKPPVNADGRILAEALTNPPAGVPPRAQKIRDIDLLLLDIEKAFAKLDAAPGAASQGPGGDVRYSPLRQAHQDYFDIERILEWRQFGTYDRFIAHHRELLARLNAMIAASAGAPSRSPTGAGR